MLKDSHARDVFDSLVQITVGDGNKVLFWRDQWIEGRGADDIAPLITRKVKTQAYNARTVTQGCVDNSWIMDIQGNLTGP
jgi:hypothetical protein